MKSLWIISEVFILSFTPRLIHVFRACDNSWHFLGNSCKLSQLFIMTFSLQYSFCNSLLQPFYLEASKSGFISPMPPLLLCSYNICLLPAFNHPIIQLIWQVPCMCVWVWMHLGHLELPCLRLWGRFPYRATSARSNQSTRTGGEVRGRRSRQVWGSENDKSYKSKGKHFSECLTRCKEEAEMHAKSMKREQ